MRASPKIRHLAVALAGVWMLPVPVQAQTQAQWKADCSEWDCPDYTLFLDYVGTEAQRVEAWYRQAGFPEIPVERLRDGVTRRVRVGVDRTVGVCDYETTGGCFRIGQNINMMYIPVSSANEALSNAQIANIAISESAALSNVSKSLAHELFHGVQVATAGQEYIMAELSDHSRKALGGDVPEKYKTLGSNWLIEGTASAAEFAWSSDKQNAGRLHVPKKKTAYNLDLDVPLISPGEGLGAISGIYSNPNLGSPYRLGQFFDHVGKNYPGGRLAFLRELHKPDVNDGYNGLIYLDRLLKRHGGSLASSFIEFLRPLDGSVGDDDLHKYYAATMSQGSGDIWTIQAKPKLTLDIPQELAKEWSGRIAGYAASPLVVEINPGPKAPATESGIVPVSIAQLTIKNAERPEDLTLVVERQIAAKHKFRRAYAQGDEKDRWLAQTVNFHKDPFDVWPQSVVLRLEPKELVIGAPPCMLPRRTADIHINQDVNGLSWGVQAGRIAAAQVDETTPDTPGRLRYTAPDKAGTYAITLRTGKANRAVKVSEVTVAPYPCKVDLIWNGDEETRSRYVFPKPGEAIGKPSGAELGGAEMVIRPGDTKLREGGTVENAKYADMMRGNMAILGGALPPEVAAEIAKLPADQRAMAEKAMKDAQAIANPGDGMATFGSRTRSFDMFNPYQATDGMAEMIFRMLLLDRLPSASEVQRQGSPEMSRRSGQPCVNGPGNNCHRVDWDGQVLYYNGDGVLTRLENGSDRIDIIHQPAPRMREKFLMLMIMDRLPWEG
ncbi:hypothetical protein [Shinella sp.]|uniref:hypothetical protein n=1 Tax=Shinella sp. TaxID=1870904 RepID=UPI003F710765